MSTRVKDFAKRGITLEARLGFKANEELDAETAALLHDQKADLLLELVGLNAVPRLDWQLERLVSAASSGVLELALPGVPDAQRYVLGWSAAYLTGDRDEALRRLWGAHRVWQGVN